MNDKEISSEIGSETPSNKGKFWCGFHGAHVDLHTQGNYGWAESNHWDERMAREERFAHIVYHFKCGEKINDWLCPETSKTKGQLMQEFGLQELRKYR